MIRTWTMWHFRYWHKNSVLCSLYNALSVDTHPDRVVVSGLDLFFWLGLVPLKEIYVNFYFVHLLTSFLKIITLVSFVTMWNLEMESSSLIRKLLSFLLDIHWPIVWFSTDTGIQVSALLFGETKHPDPQGRCGFCQQYNGKHRASLEHSNLWYPFQCSRFYRPLPRLFFPACKIM